MENHKVVHGLSDPLGIPDFLKRAADNTPPEWLRGPGKPVRCEDQRKRDWLRPSDDDREPTWRLVLDAIHDACWAIEDRIDRMPREPR